MALAVQFNWTLFVKPLGVIAGTPIPVLLIHTGRHAMTTRFKWWCCRYLLRIICIDSSLGTRDPIHAHIFHRCRDAKYKSNRLDIMCEKEDCGNRRRKNGIPKTVTIDY